MKVEIGDNEKKKKVDLSEILNFIPLLLFKKIKNIEKEISDIQTILSKYEDLSGTFNKEKFNIDKYITDFLNGIKPQVEVIHNESKSITKIEREQLKEDLSNRKVDISEEDLKALELLKRESGDEDESLLSKLTQNSVKEKDVVLDPNKHKPKGTGPILIKREEKVNLNAQPRTEAELYDMQAEEDLRRQNQNIDDGSEDPW